MKAIRYFLYIILIIAGLGCSGTAIPIESNSTLMSGNIDNSKVSVDWLGTYEGVIPCADCEGIKTHLVLTEDGLYTLTLHYLGKSNAPFIETGKFYLDKQGGKIFLNMGGGEIGYRVGENRLDMLDDEGKTIISKTDMYTLKKTIFDTVLHSKEGQLQEVRWKLIGIRGKAVVVNKNQREPYIMLKIENNRVQGFGGCNVLMGTYQLQSDNRLSFSKMASTMMACPSLDSERELLKVLEKVDSYTIHEGVLTLQKSSATSLATFEAIYGK